MLAQAVYINGGVGLILVKRNRKTYSHAVTMFNANDNTFTEHLNKINGVDLIEFKDRNEGRNGLVFRNEGPACKLYSKMVGLVDDGRINFMINDKPVETT